MIKSWESAGLLKPSLVKPVIATLEQRLVIRRLGRLNAEDLGAVREFLSRLLG